MTEKIYIAFLEQRVPLKLIFFLAGWKAGSTLKQRSEVNGEVIEYFCTVGRQTRKAVKV